MPYSTVISATPGSLNAVIGYLINPDHDHHQDYKLTPLQFCGVRTIDEFKNVCLRGFQKNKRKRCGPPPINAFLWYIIRLPDGANLTAKEMRAYEKSVIDTGNMGGVPYAIHNWHKNIYTAASDLNVLMPNFDDLGLPIRDRGTNPVRHLRWVMDQLTDELNVVRETQNSERIQTMPETKKTKAKERGEVDVVEELAALEPYPTTESSLLHGLGQLEYVVTRYSADRDSISIVPKGTKKPIKFRISQLLEDIANEFFRLLRLRQKKKKADEVEELKAQQKKKQSEEEQEL